MSDRAAAPGTVLEGRAIVEGQAEGDVLFCRQAISFLGGLDPETGRVRADNDIHGQDITGKILVFPTGAGSTVGSYVIYWLRKAGHAPAAIVNARADPVIAAGAVMAQVPMVDRIDVDALAEAERIRVDGARVEVE